MRNEFFLYLTSLTSPDPSNFLWAIICRWVHVAGTILSKPYTDSVHCIEECTDTSTMSSQYTMAHKTGKGCRPSSLYCNKNASRYDLGLRSIDWLVRWLLQVFEGVRKISDVFNHINVEFWSVLMVAYNTTGFISCAGTNFGIRATALKALGEAPVSTINKVQNRFYRQPQSNLGLQYMHMHLLGIKHKSSEGVQSIRNICLSGENDALRQYW